MKRLIILQTVVTVAVLGLFFLIGWVSGNYQFGRIVLAITLVLAFFCTGYGRFLEDDVKNIFLRLLRRFFRASDENVVLVAMSAVAFSDLAFYFSMPLGFAVVVIAAWQRENDRLVVKKSKLVIFIIQFAVTFVPIFMLLLRT